MFSPSCPVELVFLVDLRAAEVCAIVIFMGVVGSDSIFLWIFLWCVFVLCLVMFVNCLVNWLAFCLGVIAVLFFKVIVLFVMGVGFLLDSPLIVFHSMCVFRLWSQCPSRCSFHMPDLCVCMAWLMSLFKCSSLLSVGSFALIMSRSFICALMFTGSRGLLGLILPFGM